MKRSNFAEKLLDDLRMRKEQLSISTDNYTYSNKGFKGTKEIIAKSTTFHEFNYEGTKPLAFALENVGKTTRGDPSESASIISFLHEVGKRSSGYGNGERTSSQQEQPSSSSSSSSQQLPMVHVHIKEISKGTQKLNQIIKACNNGLSFRRGRRYSIQCEEKLMEGAIELEQSLRLLVDIQQASEYTTSKQRKNRIKLLEENDYEEEDAHNRNNLRIKEVAKADIEMRVLALNYQEDKDKNRRKETGSFKEIEQKGRIPNVVAKLMGLGEFPEDGKEIKNTKSAENLTRRRGVNQASENLVEMKTQRNSTSVDLVIHKETHTGNEMNYKAKSHHKDGEKDDLNSRKRNKVSYKNDGELTKFHTRRNSSSPTENKHKVVARSKQKPLQKLSSVRGEDKKSIKKAKLQREKQQYSGIMSNNHSPKPLSLVDIQKKLPLADKAKALRKSFAHVEVTQKVKEGEVNKSEIVTERTQDLNGGLSKEMQQTEIQKPNSREADEKHDQLLRSYKESNKRKTEAETCINSSEAACVDVQSSNRNDLLEHKKEIKDDSILLIAAERVPCQAIAENHHELIFTDGIDQQAPLSKSDRKSERLSKTVFKGTEGEVEPGLPLLKRSPEQRKQETKEPLSENEINLKKIVVKSQLFLDTAKALFKLNIPLCFPNEAEGSSYYQEDKDIFLDCGYELMKRKGRFQELSVHPFVKVPNSSSKVNSLDNLVRLLTKEFEKLRAYSRECHTRSFVEDYLPKMLERDVKHKDPTLNSTWDMGWNNLIRDKNDVIRDIEREIFSGLLEEITRDLICI